MDRVTRQRRILETIRDIPAGRVASYGQVAEIAGIPRGARQVGAVLRGLPGGQDVPWHRVIRSNGSIAFAVGSDAFEEQQSRLVMEGIVVRAGRVDMGNYRWQPNLDELLWKPTSAWDER
jgi:methylated-DNA-protein-cysteine methyltransferase-like protein